LKFNFANPLHISIGRKPDILIAKVIDPNLFISQITGEAIKSENSIIKV
jgi:hypothetical protein